MKICAEGLHWEEINENLSLVALMDGRAAPEGQLTGAARVGGEKSPVLCRKARRQAWSLPAWLRRSWPLILNAAAVTAFAITTVIQVTSFNRTLAATQMQTRALVTNALLERWDGSDLFRVLEAGIADGSFKYDRSLDASGLGTAPEQIMAYLNFLEDVALFHHQGVIDTEILDALFGAAILVSKGLSALRRAVMAARARRADIVGSKEPPRIFAALIARSRCLLGDGPSGIRIRPQDRPVDALR